MQVFKHVQAAGVFSRSDIQVQMPTQMLAIAILGASDINIRIRYISPGAGTKTIQDSISLATLLESNSFSEGFFKTDDETYLIGAFNLSDDGSLDLKEGYISIDLDALETNTITSVIVNAIETPILASTYKYHNPVYLNGGITREISLAGAEFVLLPVDLIKTIDIDFPSKNVSYDSAELDYLANTINDLVSVPQVAVDGVVKYGRKTFLRLAVDKASRMSITPVDATPFYCFIIEERKL